MDAHTRHLIEGMERRVRDLEREMACIPSRFAGGDSAALQYSVVTILGGNSLPVLGQAGIRRVLAAPTLAVPPDLVGMPTIVDGLGYGLDKVTGSVVLVGLFSISPVRQDLAADQTVLCFVSTTVTVTAPAGTTTVLVAGVVI